MLSCAISELIIYRLTMYSCGPCLSGAVTDGLRLIVNRLPLIEDKCKKLQFIHTVNGDGSKTAKIIKRQC